MPYSDEERTKSFCQGLRDMAALFEAHPELPIPSSVHEHIFIHGNDATTVRLKEVADAVGTFTKIEGNLSESVGLRKIFTPHVSVSFLFDRDPICHRRIVGRQKVKKLVYPTHIKPAEVEVEEEIVEWECPSFLNPDEDPVPHEDTGGPDQGGGFKRGDPGHPDNEQGM